MCCQILTDRVGGCVINTCGWVDGQGYRTLVKVCEAFKGELITMLFY